MLPMNILGFLFLPEEIYLPSPKIGRAREARDADGPTTPFTQNEPSLKSSEIKNFYEGPF